VSIISPIPCFVPQPKNTNPSCYLAFYYADIYYHLKDSLNRVIASNRADVALTKLDFEKTTSKIQLLLQEKAIEKQKRNLLLIVLVLLITAGWFYFRW
jgi:cell division protein FtsB